MNVKTTIAMLGKPAGSVIELPDGEAKEMIDAGWVTEVSDAEDSDAAVLDVPEPTAPAATGPVGGAPAGGGKPGGKPAAAADADDSAAGVPGGGAGVAPGK